MIEKLTRKRFPGIKYLSHTYGKEVLYLHLCAINSAAHCPRCGMASSRIHSYHIRTFTDVPYYQKKVIVYLRVRKFFCNNRECSQKVFGEQFSFINPDEKRSNRLIEKIVSAYNDCSAGSAVILLRKKGINVCKATVCNLKNKYCKKN